MALNIRSVTIRWQWTWKG